MKISKSFLEQIIKEEIEKVLNEYVKDPNASWWEKLLGLDKPDLGHQAVDITGIGAGAKAIQTAARAAKAVKTAKAAKAAKAAKNLGALGPADEVVSGWFKKHPVDPRRGSNTPGIIRPTLEESVDLLLDMSKRRAKKNGPTIEFYHASGHSRLQDVFGAPPPSADLIAFLTKHKRPLPKHKFWMRHGAMFGSLPGHRLWKERGKYIYKVEIPSVGVIDPSDFDKINDALRKQHLNDPLRTWAVQPYLDERVTSIRELTELKPSGITGVTIPKNGTIRFWDISSIKPENIKLVKILE